MAVSAGLDFLDAAVTADGIWSCTERGPGAPSEVMPSVFPAAVGVLALAACDSDRARSIASRSREFIVSEIEHLGVWRFEPRWPLDTDCTAVCSLAIGPPGHISIWLRRNVGPLLAMRDGEGRFLTWMSALGALGRPNDVCPVVNANVVAWLGDVPETQSSRRWIERLIERNEERDASIWYGSPMDLYYAVGRAAAIAPPLFAAVRETVASRIHETPLPNPLVTAQAISAIAMLGRRARPGFLRRWAERLIDTQTGDGGWDACEFSRAPSDVGSIYVSKTLTTACCVEALARLAGAAPEPPAPTGGVAA